METANKKMVFFLSVVILLLVFALVLSFLAQRNKPAPGIPNLVGTKEKVTILSEKGETVIVAKIDTGADFSSIDINLAKSLDFKIDPNKKEPLSRRKERKNATSLSLNSCSPA